MRVTVSSRERMEARNQQRSEDLFRRASAWAKGITWQYQCEWKWIDHFGTVNVLEMDMDLFIPRFSKWPQLVKTGRPPFQAGRENTGG